MKRIFLLPFIFALVLSSCTKSIDGYKGAKWGMSVEDVENADGFKGYRNSRGPLNEKQLSGYESIGFVLDQAEFGRMPTKCEFKDGKLIYIDFSCDNLGDTTKEKITNFYRGLDAMIFDLGKPTTRNLVKNEYGISDRYEWKLGNTIVSALMYASNFGDGWSIDASVSYSDRDWNESVYGGSTNIDDKRISIPMLDTYENK